MKNWKGRIQMNKPKDWPLWKLALVWSGVIAGMFALGRPVHADALQWQVPYFGTVHEDVGLQLRYPLFLKVLSKESSTAPCLPRYFKLDGLIVTRFGCFLGFENPL